MTRETKIGMVVAVSFLCLVGVVVATKWRGAADGADEIAKSAVPDEPKKVEPNEPNEPIGSNPAQPGPLIKAGHVTGENPPIKPPTNTESPSLPMGVQMIDPAVPMLPALPSVPMSNPGELPPLPSDPMRKELISTIDQQNKQSLPPPPPLPLPNNVVNRQNDPPIDPLAQANDNKNNGFGPVNNQTLPAVKNSGPFNKVNNEFNRLPNIEDVAAKQNEGANKTVQGASDKFDALLNKGNDASNKGIDNLNRGFDNANKNLTIPPPVAVNPPPTAANPMVPPLPTPSPADNKNNNPFAKVEGPLPAMPAPMNQSLPPITNSNNNSPFAKAEGSLPAIPAPMNQNLPPITNSNNPGFTIPAPGKSSDVKVTSYDPQPYVARQGDSFASLGKALYGAESYGNALLAYNRDWNKEYNRNSTTLQAGQNLLLPPRQVLQDRYASALADNRSGVIASGAISINPPVPAIPKSNLPAPPTSDVTKSYRIPAAGQPIYELAIQTLGDGGRWTEIYRLNPNIDPLQPIPGGTVVRLPGNARVP